MARRGRDFKARASDALADPQIRANFRRAVDGLMEKRATAFADETEREDLRLLGESIKQRALSKLPELLQKLERNCVRNGIHVHWAETVEQANEIVLEIARANRVKRIVKGKSMISEEMELNHFMERHGITCVESDLGEYIVQLAKEVPSHIIMPAIHMNRQQIAELFRREIPGVAYTEIPTELTAIARRVLRRQFMTADMGVSGVNFAIAETGTLCLVENEGNGRLSTTAPAVHVALMSIEKVIERLQDLPPLLSLLIRSATGQPITTYVNMISSPRKDGERDGPQQVHLVLLDNNRTRIYADEELRPTLQCIRCGACMNHCPVYARIGGHAYGTTYPGPIGKVLTPQMAGCDQAGDLPGASTLCGACGEVCPVRIPLPKMLLRLRREAVDKHGYLPGAGSKRKWLESRVWRWWERVHRVPLLYRWMGSVLSRMRRLPKVGALKTWGRVRSTPVPARKTLHMLMRERGQKQ